MDSRIATMPRNSRVVSLSLTGGGLWVAGGLGSWVVDWTIIGNAPGIAAGKAARAGESDMVPIG
jgi:hypothetical protein